MRMLLIASFLLMGAGFGQIAGPPAVGASMVVSSSPAATEAGLEVLRAGGNAVDAAVATFFALAVTYPSAGNIGGGGFVVLRTADGKEVALDFREAAPVGATEDRYHEKDGTFVPDRSRVGGLAAAVPGSVAGMHRLLSGFGTWSFDKALAPAIRLARDGFVLPEATRRSLLSPLSRQLFAAFPASKAQFTESLAACDPRAPWAQPDLAKTLALLAKDGPDAFYKGPIADLIVAEMGRTGGAITKEDLAAYAPKERTPLVGTYRGHRVVTMPPPSSGGIAMLQMLALLERRDVAALGFGGDAYAHLLAEVMKRAFYDRARWLGDPDFVKVPTAGLLAKEHLDAMDATITSKTVPAKSLGWADPPGAEKFETTHFAVVDRRGNAVACTTTLNGGYGSGVTVTGAGFLLNNEMDDFAVSPGKPNMFGLIQGRANRIQPGKRPLSSMTPTIVVKDDKTLAVAGSPGGPTIINTVLQMVVNVVDHEMTATQAVAAPRLHHQWMPDELLVEPFGLSPDVVKALEGRGHKVVFRGKPGRPQYQGDGHLILRAGDVWHGAADPRHEGRAAGW